MKKYGLNTICTHEGEIYDVQFKSAVSPLYMATSYEYDGVVVKRYPRYFHSRMCNQIPSHYFGVLVLRFYPQPQRFQTTLQQP